MAMDFIDLVALAPGVLALVIGFVGVRVTIHPIQKPLPRRLTVAVLAILTALAGLCMIVGQNNIARQRREQSEKDAQRDGKLDYVRGQLDGYVSREPKEETARLTAVIDSMGKYCFHRGDGAGAIPDWTQKALSFSAELLTFIGDREAHAPPIGQTDDQFMDYLAYENETKGLYVQRFAGRAVATLADLKQHGIAVPTDTEMTAPIGVNSLTIQDIGTTIAKLVQGVGSASSAGAATGTVQ